MFQHNQKHKLEDQIQLARLKLISNRDISLFFVWWGSQDESLNWFLILIINDTSHKPSKSRTLCQPSMASQGSSPFSVPFWRLVIYQSMFPQIMVFALGVWWAILSFFVAFSITFPSIFSAFYVLRDWEKHSWFRLIWMSSARCFSCNKLDTLWFHSVFLIIPLTLLSFLLAFSLHFSSEPEHLSWGSSSSLPIWCWMKASCLGVYWVSGRFPVHPSKAITKTLGRR